MITSSRQSKHTYALVYGVHRAIYILHNRLRVTNTIIKIVLCVTYFQFQFLLLSAFIAWPTEHEMNFRLFGSKLGSKRNLSTYN